MNQRQEMEEQLETNENARYVMCEEDEMFSKEESGIRKVRRSDRPLSIRPDTTLWIPVCTGMT